MRITSLQEFDSNGLPLVAFRLKRWRGSCGITIKRRQVERCVPYKERVGNEEVVRQLRLIVDDFEEDKLDFAMVYYEALDKVGQ